MFRRKKKKIELPTLSYEEREPESQKVEDSQPSCDELLEEKQETVFVKDLNPPKKRPPYITIDKDGMEHHHFTWKPVEIKNQKLERLRKLGFFDRKPINKESNK